MKELNLLPNEGIICQNSAASRTQQKGHVFGDLVLTNMNLYFVYETGTFRKTTEVLKIPVNQIKIINQQAQALVSGSNSAPHLQLLLRNGQEEFDLGGFNFPYQEKREIQNWINAINQVLGCQTIDFSEEKKSKGIPGSKEFAGVLKDTVGVFKESFGKPSGTEYANKNITCKCIGCMAPLSGTIGQKVRCKYCDTDQIIS